MSKWWPAFALVALVLALAAWPFEREAERTPMERLAASAPRTHRRLEARLSGFAWARLEPGTRARTDETDPEDMELTGVAGTVLRTTAGQQTADAQHARGVAYLLAGMPQDAVEVLERAAGAANDKQIRNDLAAARSTAGLRDPSQWPRALADADAALRIDPQYADARFNRALILERLRLRAHAARAWKRYLELDPSSAWSTEARERLRRLEEPSARFDPQLLDTTSADVLVRNNPQQARTWGEGPLLADWADAELARDAVTAAAKLASVRRIGAALATRHGEGLLADAVAAIDRADPEARNVLAQAHQLYRDARMDYSRSQFAAAESGLRRAERLFRAGASPMADMAAYYAANATFDQNRGAEARPKLLSILERVPPERARALNAQVHWTLALIANSTGDWQSGVREADASATTFRALGERMNVASVESIAAHALQLMGDGRRAWHRLQAVEALSGLETLDRCDALLRDVATVMATTDEPAAATALIDVTLESARSGNPGRLASALVKRARVAAQAGDAGGALQSLGEARPAAGKITDQALRAMMETQIAVEEASLQRAENPRAAVSTLDAALAFAERKALHLVPHVQLQRARALHASGDAQAAIAGYESALQAIETQQRAINDRSLQLTFLDTARQAFEEAIELQLSRGETLAAFRLADRRQALAGTENRFSLPAARTGIIEYAVLPKKVVIFFATSEGVDVRTSAIERGELAEHVATLTENIRRRAPIEDIRRDAGALFALLVAPFSERIDGLDELVIVPDRQLHALPFLALYDAERQRFLLEDVTVRFAVAASAAGAPPAHASSPALVVADPPTPRYRRLEYSREEARRIAGLYGGTLLEGEEATRQRFAEAARESALIHYAGHADSDAAQSYGALLLAASADDSGVLGTSDIIELSLTRRPLVVLAACGTFRGETTHVSGMPSLARAFVMAGASAVVGTLWEIDDDVAGPLFLRFHERLRAGEAPARALRDAQLDMLRSGDPRLRHPATWSPVELLTNN